MNENRGIKLAILSGCSACIASIFGKLFGLPAYENNIFLRAIFFILMMVSNGLVWTLFVKALQSMKSTVATTVISSTSNYVLAGLSGVFIFGETTSPLWWTGIFIIIFGLLLILKDQ